MESLTYQQVLADTYEEHATDIFVYQNEDDKDIPAIDNHPDELENQEDFKKEQHSRQEAGKLQHAPPFIDKTTTSIFYKQKQIKLHQFNIDSKFRELDPQKPTSISTDFLFVFPDKIKNIISMKASAIEIPNTYYVFTQQKYNTYFYINVTGTPVNVSIDDGNYEDPYTFADAVQTALISLFPLIGFIVTLGDNTAKLTISNTTSTPFSLDFTTPLTSIRTTDNGIGFNMGFRKTLYTGQSSYTGEAIVDTIGPNYIFLSLGDDYPVLTHFYDKTSTNAFAKILVNVGKNAVLYDNGSNMVTKEYIFPQPKDLSHLHIKIFDAYNEIVDIQGLNFSFTLEIQEIVNYALYNTMINPIT
jgi:hypothetical protein